MADAFDSYRERAARVRQAGREFARANPELRGEEAAPRRHLRVDVPSATFPVPAIARASLLLLGCVDLGPSEKVAWRVPFDYKGVQFGLEHQKFGVNLHLWVPAVYSDDEVEGLVQDVLNALGRVVRVAQKDVFGPAADAEVAARRITLQNNLSSLHRAYAYLRQLAEDKAGEEISEIPPREGMSTQEHVQAVFERRDQERRRQVVHSDLAHAAAIAYFAFVERFVTLALPFSDRPLDNLDVAQFIASSWGEEFKLVFDIKNDRRAQKYFGQLCRVAEGIRNPRAHGHDKFGSTTSVSIEGIGYVPLALVSKGGAQKFQLGSVDDGSFEAMTTLFDEVDAFLYGPTLGNASRWLSSGFDVTMHGEAVIAYRSSPEVFEQFLEYMVEIWEREINMDW